MGSSEYNSQIKIAHIYDWNVIHMHSCGHYSQVVISKPLTVLVFPLHMLRKHQVAANDLYLYDHCTKGNSSCCTKGNYNCWTKGNYISCTKDYLRHCLDYALTSLALHCLSTRGSSVALHFLGPWGPSGLCCCCKWTMPCWWEIGNDVCRVWQGLTGWSLPHILWCLSNIGFISFVILVSSVL